MIKDETIIEVNARVRAILQDHNLPIPIIIGVTMEMCVSAACVGFENKRQMRKALIVMMDTYLRELPDDLRDMDTMVN